MTGRGWLLLIALGLIWGTPYLLIRIAITDFSPVIVAFGRAVVGGLVLLPFVVHRGGLLAGLRNPGWLGLYTVAELCVPWVLIGYAEHQVSSATAGLIVALTPILAVIFSAIANQEALSGKRLAGLAVGLVGVGALLGVGAERPDAFAIAALVVSAIGYAIGPLIVAKRLSDRDALATVVASLWLAALFYLPAVPCQWPSAITAKAAWSVVGLAVFCTAIAFVLLFKLIAEVGADRATIVAYINPAVAVLLGVVVLDEPLSSGIVVGLPMIAIGTFLATHKSSREKMADVQRLPSKG